MSESYFEITKKLPVTFTFYKAQYQILKVRIINKSPKLESQSHIQFIKSSKYQRTYYHKYCHHRVITFVNCHHRVITIIPKRILCISNSYNPNRVRLVSQSVYSLSTSDHIRNQNHSYYISQMIDRLQFNFLKCHS